MITETIIDFFDLAEAEGRLLRKKLVQTLMVGLLMLIAAAMLLATFGFLATALYYTLIHWLHPATVFLCIALLSILIAGGILWVAISLNRRQ